MKQEVPKIIHYCWFGGKPLSELAQRCLESWKQHCPDYEIRRWDETNFDINLNDYVKGAYEAKKWAFVSDVARLHVLVQHGGIYMDTDVELLKPLDDLLSYDALSGFESPTQVGAGLMTCMPGDSVFQEMLDDYHHSQFLNDDGSHNLTTIVTKLTSILRKNGLVLNDTKQTVQGFTVLPSDYFYPKSYYTMELKLTPNTYAIHHYDASWLPEERQYRHQLLVKFYRFLPGKLASYAAVICTWLKYEGVFFVLRQLINGLKRRKSK